MTPEQKAKQLAYLREYKKANPEKVKAWEAAYRKRNAEKILATREQNREQDRARARQYYADNKEAAAAYGKKRYEENKESILARNAKWKAENREEVRLKQREYIRNRLKNDPGYLFIETARRRMLNALSGVAAKSARTVELLGCTGEEAVAHIERQFRPGMSWGNRREWHIDHIRPLASFDLTDPAQQREAFHYSNLQPLWAKDNRIKAAKYA